MTNDGARPRAERGWGHVELSLATTMPVMLSQIAAMFMMMAVGAGCEKAGFIPKDGSKVLANITCYVSLPAVIVRALAIGYDPEVMGNVASITLLAFVLVGAGVVVAHLAYGFNGERVSQLGVIISNMGFVGIPLVESVVGEEYVVYASVLIAVQTVIVWTYCIWWYTRDASMVSAKKLFTNPVIISIIAGALMFLFSVKLAGPFETVVDSIANLNSGLGMLMLGIYLAQSDLRSLVATRSIYKASILKLVVVPLVSIAVLTFWPLDVPCKLVALITIAAPCGATAAAFAQLFGGDYRFGAGLSTASTLFSLLTMPLMLTVAMMLF